MSFDPTLMGPLGDCSKLALTGLYGDCGDLYEALPGDPSPPRCGDPGSGDVASTISVPPAFTAGMKEAPYAAPLKAVPAKGRPSKLPELGLFK